MGLNWKTRVLIIILTLIAALGAYGYNQILIISPSKMNELDPLFFGENHYAKFYYNDGTLNSADKILSINSAVINSTHTLVTITIDTTTQGTFYVHPNGTVYQNGRCKGNYSIWWLHVSNPMLSFGQSIQKGTKFDVIDPTGFLGTAWKHYTVIVDRKVVYWPTDKRFWFILGAQASFEVSIYNNTDKIASATLDLTCGIIELWDGGQNSRQSLALYETSYPISRNRLNAFPALWIIGSIIIVVSYIFMRTKWENKLLNRFYLTSEKRRDTILLMIAGLIAIGIEFVDIWFYCPLGLEGNLLLHLVYVGFLAIICIIQKKRFIWLMPAILEIAFVGTISIITGDPYVPHLTAFMGSTISWLCLVWASKYDSEFDEGKTKLGKFLSKFA